MLLLIFVPSREHQIVFYVYYYGTGGKHMSRQKLYLVSTCDFLITDANVCTAVGHCMGRLHCCACWLSGAVRFGAFVACYHPLCHCIGGNMVAL